MPVLHYHLLSVTLLLMLTLFSSARNIPVLVNLQIIGLETNITRKAWAYGHNLTAIFAGPRQCKGAVEGSHHCDGTNNHKYPYPVPTFHSVLGRNYGISFTSDFCPEYDDFFITSINGEFGPNTHYWAEYLNGESNQLGGCQIKVKSGDNLLYKLIPIDTLKLTGSHFARFGEEIIPALTMTDEEDGSAVVGSGADVNERKMDAEGEVSVAYEEFGQVSMKAEKSGLLDILVV